MTWRDPSEVKQAVEELLPQWTEIDIDDALELLGPGTVDSRVRAFAVKQLNRADDDVSMHVRHSRFCSNHLDRNCFYTFCSSFRRSNLRAPQVIRGLQGRLQVQYPMTTADWRISSSLVLSVTLSWEIGFIGT